MAYTDAQKQDEMWHLLQEGTSSRGCLLRTEVQRVLGYSRYSGMQSEVCLHPHGTFRAHKQKSGILLPAVESSHPIDEAS